MSQFTSRRPLTPDEPFVDDSYLLITTGTFQKRPFIKTDTRKATLLDSVDFNCYKWGWRLLAYVILDNHYHLIVQTPAGDRSRLAHIVQSAHSFSAHHWRQEEPSIKTRIWWNFWETPLVDRPALLAHINYLHANPALHGCAEPPASYPFSSYADYLTAQPDAVREWEKDFPAAKVNIIDSF